MDFSDEMNKPMFVVRENDQTYFVTPNQIKSAVFKQKLASLYAYLAKKLQIKQRPRIILTEDPKNAAQSFGKTAYYDPEKRYIRLYVTGRHDTDILRSFAHEVIHHWQNENGTLSPQASANHYAQEDENLRKREMEAYLFGNILFRDWQDENRYGPPEKEPVMPQPIQENLTIKNTNRVKKGFEALLNAFIKDGTITSYHRDLTSGDMNPVDFVNDFASKLVGALNGQVQTINDRGNWENQSDMIKEDLNITDSNALKTIIQSFVHDLIKKGFIEQTTEKTSVGHLKPENYTDRISIEWMLRLQEIIRNINNKGSRGANPTRATVSEGHVVACPKCKAAFNYDEQPEIAMGAIKCPFCECVMDQEGNAHE